MPEHEHDVRDFEGEHKFAAKVLYAFWEDREDLFWNVCKHDFVHWYVLCNDFFYWGTADAEEIETEADLELLKQCREDCINANGDDTTWPLLYAAMHRGMRPQGAFYKHLDERLWPLFDRAGPPRETGFGNPTKHPSESSD